MIILETIENLHALIAESELIEFESDEDKLNFVSLAVRFLAI